jgi:hypothetical protein
VTTALLLIALQSAPLTDRDVTDALAAGEAKRHERLMATCAAGPGWGEAMRSATGGASPTGISEIRVMTARGLLALRAFDGRRLYKPVTLADVTEADRAPQLVVTVTPRDPNRLGSSLVYGAPAESMVLKAKDRPEVIQPTSFTTEPVEWKNLLGGVIQSNTARATFDLSAFVGLPAGDVDVVVITAGGERRCKIGREDRLKLTR